MKTTDVVAKLNAAVKAITRADVASGLLTVEKSNRFIRVVEESTPILKAARRLPMNSHTRDIDRIAFSQRVLRGQKENEEITNEAKPNTYLNKLESKEVGGYVSITDHTLEDNIEKKNFENTVLDLMGGQVGRDLSYLLIQGDTDLTGDPLLKEVDGWIKKAGNVLTASGTETDDFNPTKPAEMFSAMLDALPKKYLQNRSQWRYYVGWDIDEDYRQYIEDTRPTSLGDTVLTGSNNLAYRGIPVEVSPELPAGQAMLVLPSNMVYGLYRDIRVEPERLPKLRRTDFVVTLRTDCNYEDENAVVVAEGYSGYVRGSGAA
ncbi:hypothetical protein GCM10007416_00680 [Kroppenstedtia guangzhouensis]|uniref:Phage major capsid protein, HK97 family n=1 Tax=Kroppenstedtia guangzhouensis TaxID=1274356 RepID=A0ABQ1FVJ8_9BACL|nr:phage major capsid protein [Kroppenstedtia guangzhouensis]GGA31990.1 hypothetical protein GCM10007416_00680 [Kroppenstedtia guangzhouensis]